MDISEKNKIDITNKKVVIIGLGKSGCSAAKLAHHLKAKVFVSDNNNNKEVTQNLQLINSLGISGELKNHSEKIYDANLWIVSPGVPQKSSLIQKAQKYGIPIVSEIEFHRMARRIPWRNHAILFRTNQQSRPLETALRKAEVRYNLVGGQSFFDRREIRDFVSYLKLFLNPDDDTGLLRIANVPARGLSNATMEKLLGLSQERGCTVFAVMRDEPALGQFQRRTVDSILDFVELVESVNERLNRPIAVQPANPLKMWCTAWLDEVGLFREIRRMEKDEETAENRVRNIVDLLDSMDPGFVPADRPVAERLHRFLEHISLDRERDEDEEIGDAVTLITVHSCKGLEFPHVYIAGVEDGLIPHSRSKAEGTLDEERRLFYVAITRAQVTLTMSHCENRRKFGELIPCHPSPFLKEIPEELIVHGNESEPVSEEAGLDFFASLKASLE